MVGGGQDFWSAESKKERKIPVRAKPCLMWIGHSKDFGFSKMILRAIWKCAPCGIGLKECTSLEWHFENMAESAEWRIIWKDLIADARKQGKERYLQFSR